MCLSFSVWFHVKHGSRSGSVNVSRETMTKNFEIFSCRFHNDFT